MSEKEDDIQIWNRLASPYEHLFMDLTLYNDSYDEFLAMLPQKGAEVLDAGCGPGNISRYLLGKRPDLQLLGVDYSDEMIRIARKNNPAADYMQADCRDLSGIGRSFDGIIAGFCISYLTPSETEKLINDCSKLLKRDGVLYISFTEGKEEDSGNRTGSTGETLFFRYYPSEKIGTMMRDAGFTGLKEYRFPYPVGKPVEMHSVWIGRFIG